MKTDDQKELERFLFDLGRIVLGKEYDGGLIAKLKNARGVTGAWNVLKAAHGTSGPKEYIGGALRGQRETAPPISPERAAELIEKYRKKREKEGWI